MSTMHLAQINVARMLAPLDSPIMAGFVAQLDALNALADASPGFVWRLQGPAGDATSIAAFDDPLILVNMSVWESMEALHAYVYRTNHRDAVRNRKSWFTKYDGPYYALWWVAPGTVPGVDEGKARLDHLARNGPSDHAFWFVDPFTPGEKIANGPSAG